MPKREHARVPYIFKPLIAGKGLNEASPLFWIGIFAVLGVILGGILWQFSFFKIFFWAGLTILGVYLLYFIIWVYYQKPFG